MKTFKSIGMVFILMAAIALSILMAPNKTAIIPEVLAADDDCASCYAKEGQAYQDCIDLGFNSGMCSLMGHAAMCDCMQSKHCVVQQCDSN